MSSTFEAPTAQRLANGDAETRIIHFDATERRREKMRRAAVGEKTAAPVAEAPAPREVPALKPAVPAAKPAAPAPVAKAAPAVSAPKAPAAISPAAFAPKPAAPAKPAAAPAPTNGRAAGTNGTTAAKPAAPAPVAKAPTPAPAHAKPAAAPAMDLQQLETFLVNFVVEQTGYPAEMVELDADLEADLGIDSIKKAQLFGELSEHFEVTVSEDLKLEDFSTLRHVVNFLKDKPAKGASGSNGAGSSNGVAAHHAGTNGTANGHAGATKPAPAPAPVAKAAPAPARAPAPAAVPAMSPAELETFLVNFVVEQTGYPAEMVELDADLEADLGIDSIKKAQLFGELSEHFEVTVSEDLKLEDFTTLRHVSNFLADKPAKGAGSSNGAVSAPAAPAAVAAPAPAAKPAPVAKAAPAPVAAPPAPAAVAVVDTMPAAELESFLVNFVVEQTGYPAEMVELDADLEADLGIDSIKKAQLFGELAEHFEVTVTENLKLEDFTTLRHVMGFLANVPRKH